MQPYRLVGKVCSRQSSTVVNDCPQPVEICHNRRKLLQGGRIVDEKELLSGLRDLDALSEGDYREPLSAVVRGAPDTEALGRLGRLIGVTLKEPFAHSQELPIPSFYSHSYRAWELDEKAFDSPDVSNSWQYQTLEALRRELQTETPYPDVRALAVDAHYERGFFGYLARSVQKYICGDPKLRKAIDEKVRDGRASGFNVKIFTPEQLVQGGGVALASLLITHVPVLGLVGAPVIAGLVLLFYSIGADAFCQWAKDLNSAPERL
jgi:hypothetical protein